jgi:hypothetical protein
MHGRLRWLHRLPLVLSRHATVSTVPRFQGQGRPPGQALGDKHAAVRAGLAGNGPPGGLQPPLPAPRNLRLLQAAKAEQRLATASTTRATHSSPQSSSQLDQRCGDRTQIEGEQHGVPGRSSPGYVSPGTVPLSADRFLRPATPDPRRSARRPKGRSPPPLAAEVGEAGDLRH